MRDPKLIFQQILPTGHNMNMTKLYPSPISDLVHTKLFPIVTIYGFGGIIGGILSGFMAQFLGR